MHHFTKNQWPAVGVIALVVAVVFTGIGYEIGRHQSGPATIAGRGGYGTMGGGGSSMRRMTGNNAMGSILSMDSTSITLATMGGGSKTILLSPSTTILKTAPGSTSDLSSGDNIIVNGTANADGSISASSISIRPAGSMPGNHYGGQTSAASASGSSNQ